MDNPEFIQLRNRFFFGLFVAAIVVFAGILLFSRKFGDMRSEALEAVNSDKTFLLFVVDSKNCHNCSSIGNSLDNLVDDYIQYDIYRSKDLDDLCFKLGIEKNHLKAPSLIYVENGEKVGSIFNVSNDKVVEEFLRNYGFIHN